MIRLLLLAPFALLVLPVQDDVWSQAELERVSARIQKDVEEMRGQKFQRDVAVKMADEETFLAHAVERMERFMSPEMLEGTDTVARMLGLIPPDMNLMEETMELLKGQVGGFYSPGEDTFYLMDSFAGPLAEVILAHELTHALDDQYFDLDKTFGELMHDSDKSFAYAAVVEGSGTSLMNQWTIKKAMSGEIDAASLADADQMGMDVLEEAPSFIWLPLLSAYLRGASFLTRSDSVMAGQAKAVETEDVRTAFENPPVSSEQILHPEKYWDEDERDVPRAVSYDTGSLPSGCRVIYQDTLGEINLALFATPDPLRPTIEADNPMSVIGVPYTNSAAAGWGGDRVILIAKDDARFLRLVTVWDTERDAAEFFGALSIQENSLRKGLTAAAASLSGDDSTRTKFELKYNGPREVELTMSFGFRRSHLRKLRDALSHSAGE